MSEEQSLVSIITTCYNGSRFLQRYFESILRQSYDNIQLIFVDDGSEDSTFEIAASYQAAIEERGYSFVLLHQDNSGQAAAINRALPYAKGEFISWIDSDDIMYSDCVECKVLALRANEEADFVFAQVNVVNEDDLNTVVGVFKREQIDNPWLFDSLLTERDGYCCPIAYLARTRKLLDVLPPQGIYESRAGQNWQLLLPLAYYSKCCFIDKPLASYVVRNNSHSHSIVSAEQMLKRTYELEDVLRHVISSMDLNGQERSRINLEIERKYIPQRLKLAIETKNDDLFEDTKLKLKAMKEASPYSLGLIAAHKIHCGNLAIKIAGALYQLKQRFS